MLEVIVETLQDALKAQAGGADQLDVKKDYNNGGITPDIETLKAIVSRVDINVMVMIRPRLGDFVYSLNEIHQMVEAILRFKRIGVDGFLLGALNADKTLNLDAIKQCLKAASNKDVHVHLSWEETPKPLETLQSLIRLGIKSVRITGGKGLGDKAESNIDALKYYRQVVGDKMALVLAGGVNADNLSRLMIETNIANAHVGSGVRIPKTAHGKVDVEKIRQLKAIHDNALRHLCI